MTQLQFRRNECSLFEQTISREWLVTNGICGFSSGTICDTNMRRYHGLLLAALASLVVPPLLVAALMIYAWALPLVQHRAQQSCR